MTLYTGSILGLEPPPDDDTDSFYEEYDRIEVDDF